jgi:ferrochelatase
MARLGVLLVAYGGPRDLDEIAPFMASIMGTEPSEAALQDARRRYLTIGGISPLPFTAERIAVQLERSLSGLPEAPAGDDEGVGLLGMPAPLPRAAAESVKLPVAVGMLHSEPSISAAVRQLADSGVREVVVLSLSPFECASTTGKYARAVEAAASEAGVAVREAGSYRTSDPFVGILSDNLEAAMGAEEIKDRSPLVVFAAHSLPVAEIEADPCYVDQLRQTATAVAARLELGAPGPEPVLPGIEAFGGGDRVPWVLAFQSKGKRGGAWIGPDIEDVIDAAGVAGFTAVVVSPLGFAIDHMETLYDLDVVAAERALDQDIEFSRAQAPNDASLTIEALAEAVRKVL